jgi:hypothetical protein
MWVHERDFESLELKRNERKELMLEMTRHLNLAILFKLSEIQTIILQAQRRISCASSMTNDVTSHMVYPLTDLISSARIVQVGHALRRGVRQRRETASVASVEPDLLKNQSLGKIASRQLVIDKSHGYCILTIVTT